MFLGASWRLSDVLISFKPRIYCLKVDFVLI